jgi:FkbM family methyltransferase
MQLFRRFIFRTLGLTGYLSLVRNSFFIAFKLGLLRKNPAMKWHYFVKKLVHKGDKVIDIGANLGYFSNTFCQQVGPSGHVYSVEPVTPFKKQLEKQLSWAKNNTIYNCALGAENIDEIVLGMPEQVRNLGYMRTGLPSILHGENQQADGVNTFASSLRKASELFAHIPVIDYIKCDIEGYEWIVFQEMSALIDEKRPTVQAECWEKNFTEILDFFTAKNYETFKLRAGVLVKLSSLEKNQWGDDDTLFVPKEKVEHLLG